MLLLSRCNASAIAVQELYCFPIQRWLDKGESDRKTHVTLTQQSSLPCSDLPDSMLASSASDHSSASPISREFIVRTQTADKSLRGKSDRPVNVYLDLYDKNNQLMADSIRLEKSMNHKTPFQRHHTDKFPITIRSARLADISRIDLYHDGHNDG